MTQAILPRLLLAIGFASSADSNTPEASLAAGNESTANVKAEATVLVKAPEVSEPEPAPCQQERAR
jgi:hypothetical protein